MHNILCLYYFIEFYYSNRTKWIIIFYNITTRRRIFFKIFYNILIFYIKHFKVQCKIRCQNLDILLESQVKDREEIKLICTVRIIRKRLQCREYQRIYRVEDLTYTPQPAYQIVTCTIHIDEWRRLHLLHHWQNANSKH